MLASTAHNSDQLPSGESLRATSSEIPPHKVHDSDHGTIGVEPSVIEAPPLGQAPNRIYQIIKTSTDQVSLRITRRVQ